MTQMIARSIAPLVAEAMGDTRAVYIMGARQVGKSTLVEKLTLLPNKPSPISLDDATAHHAAEADPVGFIHALQRPVILDEVQRVPELLLAIKVAVDRDASPGQFLLTGSANLLTNRKIKDALTGRLELITLWPFTQAELSGSSANLIDALLTGTPPMIEDAPVGRSAFVERIAAGGYPEAVRRTGRRRDSWFASYLETTLDRDLRDISDARRLEDVPRLLRLAATQSANLLNVKSLADRLGLNPATANSYLHLLETMFLIRRIPAWRPGLGQREVSKPKLHVVDSGLLAHLLGADEERIASDDQVTGKALESLVAMDILRLSQWGREQVRVFHYQDGRDEVDLVLETRSGSLAAIEVKASATLTASSWRSLAKLRDRVGSRLTCGVVLYAGAQTLPLADRLWAVPLSALWQVGQ